MTSEGSTTLTRLDDFILLAMEGKEVEAEVALRRTPITQKAHPDETDDSASEVDAYLLAADFAFRAGEETRSISKVYIVGYEDESVSTAQLNKSIANDRLKMDYRRLEEAHLRFKKRYFE